MIDKTENITSIEAGEIDRFPPKSTLIYKASMILSLIFTIIGILAVIYTLQDGLHLWGINNRISWGLAIVNFVFWIGIGHAGTLISAILFLLNQKWRVQYNRMAELMTIIAVLIAAIFPLLHTGRPWFSAYWLLPYYNQMSLMPNFKSPLTWDIFAIFTYFIISCIFFYLGLLPDLSLIKTKVKNDLLNRLYNKLSYFWIGTKKQWDTHRTIYIIIAGIATPLVISVHSVVSFDFFITMIPAWHTAILPPYFVMGAIFSGLAMVNVIYIIYNKLNDLSNKNFKYIEKINKLILFGSLTISFVYLIEFSTSIVESSWKTTFLPLLNGGFLVYLMLICNSLMPLLFIFKKVRHNYIITFLISIFILLGMWIERYLIVIQGQELSTTGVDKLLYLPTAIDWALLVGSFGAFMFLFLLFGRILPMRSITEGDSNAK